MGNAFLSRRGGSGGSSYELKTEIYETNKLWTVPKAKDQKFMVRIFGGGSSGGHRVLESQYCGFGGSGGFMNNGDFTLQQGTTVQITIGSGGIPETESEYPLRLKIKSGGITSFGTYLAANGGSAQYGGSGGGILGVYSSVVTTRDSQAGTGYQFGGGGGGWKTGCMDGGNGGYYGGGGGTCYAAGKKNGNGGTSINYQYNSSSSMWEGTGSGLGGNGGGNQGSSTDGTNTDSNSYLKKNNLSGFGKAGGYSTAKDTDSVSYTIFGGGGGYGGNGGNNCGGGGGYGAKGGDGYIQNSSYGKLSYVYGGGGGGYGKGGYGGNATEDGPGGGGGYGHGGDGGLNGIHGGGGGYNASGGNGICIIQYYAKK